MYGVYEQTAVHHKIRRMVDFSDYYIADSEMALKREREGPGWKKGSGSGTTEVKSLENAFSMQEVHLLSPYKISHTL